MTFIKATPLNMDTLWPLLSPLRYDNLLDALIHGFHGEMMTDDLKNPSVFLGFIGWNYYLSGNPNSKCAIELIKKVPYDTEIHTTALWVKALEAIYPNQLIRKTRYAHHANDLNKDHLNKIINALNPNYHIKPIDKPLYNQILKEGWGEDFVGNFKDYQDFKENGLGFLVLDNETIISGCSSYIRFNGGYEIEIITRNDYRNQGLAKIIGAYFTLECLKRNKIPHWDAAHESSKRLASKLGFTFAYAYEVFIIKEIT
ncbi:GNAT family N-acetyltransferase [Liberiplasma polymorphum]|uniref:GNAT family N-acetyltransferase n=1 Tax=Liberiplasma polymorphum TaxID=3374570 RepID=UPI003774CCFB